MFAGVMKNAFYLPLMIIKSHEILFLGKTQIKWAFEKFTTQKSDNQNKIKQ